MANGRGSGRRTGTHASAARLFKKDSIGIEVVSDVAQALKQLERGIQEKVLRSGAHAGVEVFYKEMRLRVPFASGQLYESIYQWHDDKQSTATKQIYATGPNKRKAPHWHWVEYGNIRMAAQPFVRPAFAGKQQASLSAMSLRMAERMKELLSEMRK